jgi:Type II secretion system (T2SS), protein E, N-terminal domain
MSVQPARSRLGDVLIDAGVLTREQLERALAEQAAWGGRLGQILLNLGLVEEGNLASAIGRQLGLRVVDLDRLKLTAGVSQLLPLEVAERYGVMPLGRRDEPRRLLLACFDPTMAEAVAEAQRASGLKGEVYVATSSAIERAIRRVYYGEATPAPVPGAGAYSVTRHTRDPSELGTLAEDVVERVTELEREVEKLKQLLETLIRPAPH